MISAKNFKTITQLRLNTLEIINTVRTNKIPIYIISRSKPKAIIIGIDQYGELLESQRENRKLKKIINNNQA